MNNCLQNAVKYRRSDLSIHVAISAEQWKANQHDHEMDVAQVTVHNWGEPIAVDDQKFLFEPFRRTKSAEVSSKRGWGLGLALVKGIVEAHGGQVSVESSRELGTTFKFVLPLNSAQLAMKQEL